MLSRRSIFPVALAFVLAVSLINRSASATVWNMDILLDGLQETPPVATPASGVGTATLDDVTLQFVMTGTFSNLFGTTTNAHVHGPAAIGSGPAGVLFPINFDFGVTSGNFSHNGVITLAQAQTILDGFAYVNIHSTFRPGGEIRGQILVPEPASVSLLALAGIAGLRRRR